MSSIPAAVLSKMWEHFDYYLVMDAELVVDAEELTQFTVDVSNLDAVRYLGGDRHPEKGRRCFDHHEHGGKLWVDRTFKNGEVTETRPWVDNPGAKPRIVQSVEVNHHG